MKHVLIFSHAMEIGGAERALLGLLNSFDYSKYTIDLFMMRHRGELFQYIPEQVNLLSELPQYASLATPIRNVIRTGQIKVAFGRAVGKYLARRYAKSRHLSADNSIGLEYSHKFTCPLMPKIQANKEYDLAISFLTPHYFVAKKVQAKKKIAWIHTDYSKVQVDVPSETAMWSAYDYIASISDGVTDSFIKVFPTLKEKIVLIQNILPERLICQQARSFSVEIEMPQDGSIKLLSIGRFCTAKNFDNVPDICARLIGFGLNIKWDLIGYGGDEALIRHRIAEAHLEEHVILLGKKENPYPYMKACDLYVQPSRYEGNCVCVHEAQMLGKPVVITNYATSVSQLEDGIDGVIVPMDNEGCAVGIAALLRNPEKMRQLSENCKARDYSNAQEVEKIYNLME